MKKLFFVMLFMATGVANGSDWAHNAIDLTHQYGNGSGVVVGVLDGVTRCSHQELAGKCNNYFPTDFTGTHYSDHGTHVATIIAGVNKAPDWLGHNGGVAPGARINNYAVFDSYSTYDAWWISNQAEIEMANLAASHGATVINQSYGDYTDAGHAYISPQMLQVWRSHGNILFVNAAGNEGTVLDRGANPGNINNVIFVGAADQSGNIASWSNRPGGQYKNQFIVAPGDYISGGFALTDDDYGHMSGTSMAAPIVTGVVAILHDHWGHLKGNPSATAGIIFDSAIDKGAPGVDNVYGHGMLNVRGIFEPIAIVDPGNPPGGGGDDCPPVDDVPPVNPPGDTIGTPGDGIWFDSKGDRHLVRCTPPVDVLPPDNVIGTPGDGIWFDGRDERSYFVMSVNGKRRILKRINANSALIRSASDLDMVFFDKYGRDYKTNAANYKSTSVAMTDYMGLTDGVAVQFVNDSSVNYKIDFDGLSIGKGRSGGFKSNGLTNLLDDGMFVSNGQFGMMYSDDAVTTTWNAHDNIQLQYIKENGFLGSTGAGKYDTIASTLSKDNGTFFGSTTMAYSRSTGEGNIVRMSDSITSLAFEAGVKGTTSKNWNWKLSVYNSLQPVDGTMTVAYDDKRGRSISRTIDMGDSFEPSLMFKINYQW